MNVIAGNLWDELGVADLLLVTTNAAVNARGEVVMGRGAAREAKARFPDLPRSFGAQLIERGLVRECYGLLHARQPYGDTQIWLGAFQVKIHWQDEADPGLIRFATGMLRRIAAAHPERRIAMNYPGIGNGRLSIEQVAPILADLPDNVFVYMK